MAESATGVAPAIAPLIVQQDGRLLLATQARSARGVADTLRRFAELEKCPGDYHVYHLTRHSLWNAAAEGITADRVLDYLCRAGRAPVPPAVERLVRREIGRYGRLWLAPAPDAGELLLRCDDPALLAEVAGALDLGERLAEDGLRLPAGERGWLKHRLAKLGYPVRDEVGYADGAPLAIAWRPGTRLRPYQREAVEAFAAERQGAGGSGLVLLPCGAGKTLVGVGATVALGRQTLVLCPNTSAVRQWVESYAAFTTLPREAIGEYGLRRRQVRPVTVTTYQMLTARRTRAKAEGETDAPLPHLALFMNHDWGLVVYDEVQMLPADVFRLTAEVQSRRRLGLTATPVREDGREADLFALVGPVLYSAAWGRLEDEGWIAPASCVEVRVPVSWDGRVGNGAAELGHREAASAAAKWPVARAILRRHRGEPALVLGQYLDQLRDLAARLGAPLITGQTPPDERERLFARYRAGEEPVLVLSRVGNAAIDLPDAALAIEVSGNFGSRQEEAQRLGRVLRTKGGRPAHFYALVTDGSVERAHAERRRRFLVEQGYQYRIVEARELLA